MSTIKKFTTLFVIIGSAIAAISVAPAFAAPVWQSCIKIEGEGSFENEGCTKESEAGTFEFIERESGLTVKSKGSLEFEDAEANPAALRVKCTAEVSATVGPAGEGKVSSMELSACTVVKGTCESPKVSAVHVSWNTELVESGSEIRNDLVSGGSGFPGYKISCGSGTKTEDTCEFEKTSTGMTNVSSEAAVDSKFDSKSGKASCNHAGNCPSMSGIIEGSVKTEIAAVQVDPKVTFLPPALTFKKVNGEEMMITITNHTKKTSGTMEAFKIEGAEAAGFMINDAKKCEGKTIGDGLFEKTSCVIKIKLVDATKKAATFKGQVNFGGGLIIGSAVAIANP